MRAIAALSVVISHTLLENEYFGIQKIVAAGWGFASYGVTMFFTLSGFLITFLLLKEKEAFSTVSIPKFYVRRILRIWPLYYFYIFLVLIITFREGLPADLPYYLFMGANIPSAAAVSVALLSHYWSLGVEEQFYIFWPWLVKLFSPLKSVTIFLIFFLMVKAVLRILMPQSFSYQLIGITRFDCMAIGALWAILMNKDTRGFKLVCFNVITQILAWGVLLLAAIGKLKVPDFINQDVFSISSAVIILNVAFNKKSLIDLDNRILNFLGKISYGVYVYHVLVIYCLGLLLKGRLPALNVYAQVVLIIFAVVAITILVSWLSYEYLEKRFLKFKDRFSKVFSRA